jgi:Tfp pilus assembly PilM family ATPase
MSHDRQIGIKFNRNEARAVVVDFQPIPSLKLAHTFALEGGIGSKHLYNDPKSVVATLANWVQKNELKGSPAVFSVPSSNAFISWTKLPEVTGTELLAVARYRLRKQFPKMDENAVVAVAQPNGVTEESLAIGVDRHLIDQRADILSQAGLVPIGAEVEAQAMLRIVDHYISKSGSIDPNSSIGIVQIGTERTQFIIIQAGKLGLLRTVRVGSKAIEAAVQEALQTTSQGAISAMFANDTWLFNRQFISSLNGRFDPIDIEPQLQTFVKEFRLLVNYFRSLHPERSYAGVLSKLVVLGQITRLRGFTACLADQLGTSLESFNPLIGLGVELNAEDYAQVVEEASLYSVPIGLAQAPYGQSPKTNDSQNPDEYRWSAHAA